MISKLKYLYEVQSLGDNRTYRIGGTLPLTDSQILTEVRGNTDMTGPFEISEAKHDGVWEWMLDHLREFRDNLPSGIISGPGFDLDAIKKPFVFGKS